MCSKWEFANVSTQKWTTLHEREDEEGKEELLYLLIQKIEFKDRRPIPPKHSYYWISSTVW